MSTQAQTSIAPWVRTVQIFFIGLATIMLLFSLIVYFVYAANLISFPFDYDQGEGFELVDTIMFSRLQWPYQDTETYPFYASNYPPVFHVMAAPFVWFFGEAYWYGRLLGFLGTLVSATCIGYVVWREGGHRWISLAAGLAFLASNTVYHIGPLLRQHMTMVMFEILAITLLAHAYPRRKRGQIALALFLLILAGYTKQLAAFTAIAALLWMFLRNPRRAMLWGIAFAVTGAGIFAWMTWATNGEWWRQAILANANQVDPVQIIALFELWIKLHGFLILPALLFVLYELYLDRISVYSAWFVVTIVLGGVSAGTWGGGDSYYATSIAAMCILSGIFLARSTRQSWSMRQNYVSNSLKRLWAPLRPILMPGIFIVVPLLYLGYGIATLKMPTTGPFFGTVSQVFSIEPNITEDFFDSATFNVRGYARIGYLTTQEDIDAGYRIVAMMQAAEGPVLSEEAGFNLAAGKDVVTNPTQLLNLWFRGLFDGSELLGMIENQEFELIVMRAQFYPLPVLEAIAENYEQSEIIRMNRFDYTILRPIASSPD